MATVNKSDFVAFMFTADTSVTLAGGAGTFTAKANVPYTTSGAITAVGTILLMKGGTRAGKDVLQCFSVDEVRTLA